jgi:hypothetical protein
MASMLKKKKKTTDCGFQIKPVSYIFIKFIWGYWVTLKTCNTNLWLIIVPFFAKYDGVHLES